jgi:hypothetical protein
MDILTIIAFHVYWPLWAYALLAGWRGRVAQRKSRWVWFLVLLGIQFGFFWYLHWPWQTIAVFAPITLAVFVPWQPDIDSRGVRLVWFITLPLVVFVGFQLAGCATWDVLYWWIYGDEYDSRDPDRIAIVNAFLTSVIVFIRLALGRAGLRYRVVTLVGSLGLLGLFVGDRIIHFVARMESSTAQSAAQAE